ncbi:MAG: hypothetical protein HDR04_09710 [Lachnospiraceae bacterium]|nr:hypothetical protein [Lachnospiraceae bacterium]
MGMGGMIDFLFLASGVYLIYSAVMAKHKGNIAANVMLSKNTNENDIRDKVGFIDYMYKKIFLTGVMIILASVIYLVNDYYIHSIQLSWIGIVMILLALAIYTFSFMRGRKLYIDQRNNQKNR